MLMQSQLGSYSAMQSATRQSCFSSLSLIKGVMSRAGIKNWCLLPGIRAVLEAIEKRGEAGKRQSD